MKNFMDKDFLLSTQTAKELYHNYASKMPIIDYHCHINPKEIAEDKKFRTITEAWLGGDHYKWRLMRANGIAEEYITGNASDYDKFVMWAKTLQKAIGNPLYHWSHLELQRYFNYYGVLNEDTADNVYRLCNEQLQQKSVRTIIKDSNVDIICTTDDPIDSLEWHKKIKQDETFSTKVLPALRPDKAMNIEKSDYTDYLTSLSEITNETINSFKTLCKAIVTRIDFFHSMGCKISDHALPFVMYQPSSPEEIEEIFTKRLQGIIPSPLEESKYKTALLVFLGKEYHKRQWTMQLHYGTKRDNNTKMFQSLGPDTGYDCIDSLSSSAQMAHFLNELDKTEQLPKTIIYSLNPADNAIIETVIGCFQDSLAVGKLQHGSAWWFNDNKQGMIDQLTNLANLGLLANFIGMLTDSRSFLSYTRHEYFRRILCDLIGNLVENGEYPNDFASLSKIVQDISYNNSMNYFEF